MLMQKDFKQTTSPKNKLGKEVKDGVSREKKRIAVVHDPMVNNIKEELIKQTAPCPNQTLW